MIWCDSLNACVIGQPSRQHCNGWNTNWNGVTSGNIKAVFDWSYNFLGSPLLDMVGPGECRCVTLLCKILAL